MSRTQRTRFSLLVWIAAFAMASSVSAFGQHYTRTDLTVDQSSVSPTAPNTDPNLQNAWGLARGSGTFWWIADNGTGVSTLHDGAGASQQLIVKIPPPNGQNGTAAPTGVVFNYTTEFEVAPGKPALFIFVTEDGTISAWNPQVDVANAVLKVDRSGKANYKGCTIALTSEGPRLFVTNFQSGHVEVYDGKFHRVHTDDDLFRIGKSSRVTPFNIQNVGGKLVVTFAFRNPGEEDEEHGAGLGQAGIFSLRGHLLVRLQQGQWFNAPWGVALAPSDFGAFSHRLLIGNFGDGTINVFNVSTGSFQGTLLQDTGGRLKIDGLWALQFGGNAPDNKNGAATELFFTAGPNDEKNGLLGKITPVSTEQRGTSE